MTNREKTSVLLLTLICMAGIAVAIAQPVLIANGDVESVNCSNNDSVTHAPILIYGYVQYTEGVPSNVNVTITNLNTSYNTTARTDDGQSYYQIRTSSAHICSGDTIRFNASEGGRYSPKDYTVTDEDIKSGGFMQSFVGLKPDLVITEKSESFNESEYFTVSYRVENRGDEIANKSNTSIYVDGVLMMKDPVRVLAPGEYYENTIGSFRRAYDKINVTVMVCADGDDVVNESAMENNNCMENELIYDGPLPNLIFGEGPIVSDTDSKGRFTIYYYVNNRILYNNYPDGWWQCGTGPTNTSISITNVSVDGSTTDITFKDRVPGLSFCSCYERTFPFTCSPGKEVVINFSLDGDHDVLEYNEADNHWTTTFLCPAKPDLIIVKESISTTWLNRTNKTFTIDYTVKNIGNTNATASTTYVYGKNDSVPELAPGESHTSNSVGPFQLSGDHTTITICADYYGDIAENNEDNNCVNYLLAVPILTIWPANSISWIDPLNKTYDIRYGVTNDGYARSNVSKVSVYVDDNPPMEVDCPPLRGRDAHGMSGYTYITTGPFTMTGDNDTIKLCVEWGWGRFCHWSDTTFGWGGCLSHDDNKTLYNAYDPNIQKSCTFTGDMSAYPSPSLAEPTGLFISADDITIDGNGSALIGEVRERRPGEPYWYNNPTFVGINNRCPGDKRYTGYKNVTIKNMEIRKFHIGISIGNTEDITIENCTIHDNGATDKYSHGITVGNSNHVKIDNCSVYNITGNCTYTRESGGHGIDFRDDCDYCNVTNSNIYHNYLSGIHASPTCKYLDISNNLIEDNGYCGRSGFCTGVNLHWKGGKGMTTNSTVLGNVILNNTGSGIYTTQGGIVIKDNIVKGSKNGTDVTGNGILIDGGWLTFLYNNTFCDSGKTDIVNDGHATFGDDNTCDTTDDYGDEGMPYCTFYCDGVNGVCIGKTDSFGCGDTVTESCTFNRTISCPLGGGLIAGADDITIDGSGYKLIGDRSGTGILSSQKNVTIRNLQVTNFSTGILIENTIENTIKRCNVRKNNMTGINLTADGTTVNESRIYDNTGTGIVVGGDHNIFLNNTAVLNMGYGIYFGPNATNNTIIDNAIGDNGDIDINNTNDNGTSPISDNNTCDDPTQNYWDLGMIKDKRYGCVYPWTPPDLTITWKGEEWINKSEKTYNISYKIANIGEPDSRPVDSSTTWLYINLHHFRCADDLIVDLLKPGEVMKRTFDYEAMMAEDDDEDEIKVCADGPDEIVECNLADVYYHKIGFGNYTVPDLIKSDNENCEYNTYYYEEEPDLKGEGGACIARDGNGNVIAVYTCGDYVEHSCTFDANMKCEGAGHGLIIEKDGITIDGNDSALIGPGENLTCGDNQETAPGSAYCGILNSGQYNNVRITNLEITGFCNGIGLGGCSGNIIEKCDIHHNGDVDKKNQGIHLVGVDRCTIRDNYIHHNRGGGDHDCGGGGNGIFLYADKKGNNLIAKNHIYNNDKSGFWTKMQMHDSEITYNVVHDNGYGGVISDYRGGIILMCMMSNHNLIKGNTVYDNNAGTSGGGIAIGGERNTIEGNNVTNNGGYGIHMHNQEATDNKLYGNTVCEHVTDICSSVVDGNSGEENTCDMTEGYHDVGRTGCTYPCANPDLIVADKFETWIGDPDNRTYEITYTVENIGCIATPETEVRIIIDDKLKGYYPVPALAANGSNTSTVSSFTLTEHEDVIDIMVDPRGRIDEGPNEDNNNRENIWDAKPDLTVTEIDVPDEISMIFPNNATATVANIGTIKIEKEFDVELFVNNDHADTVTIKNLAAGRDTPVEFTWRSALELNELKVFADSGYAIEESDETNNINKTSVGENGNGTGNGTGKGPQIDPGGGVHAEDLVQPGEVDPGEGVGGNIDYGDIGNGTVSGRVSKERVHAQLFRSNPFIGAVKDVVVSYAGITGLGIGLIAVLFLFGYRSEIMVHRRNGR